MPYSQADIERDKIVREIVREHRAQQQAEERNKAREKRERSRAKPSGQKEPLILKADTAIRNAIWGKGNW